MSIKVDGAIGYEKDFHDLRDVAARVHKLRELGFDGVSASEVAHDPFPALTIAAYEAEGLDIRTSIAVALARNPMSMASLCHDMNVVSGGRFTLGIGSQIKPHITRRYHMPWHAPARQMREYIEAMHAIWDCWYEGKPLDYRGECYQHTLMTPEFMPTNTQFGRPRVMLAAVGPKMVQTAAEVADGIILHPFCTPRHLHEVLLPAIETHLAAAGRSRDEFEVQFSRFMACGESEQELQESIEQNRFHVAFYASTPAYRSVLETHGWGDLQGELKALTLENRWAELPSLITDDVLDAFVCSGTPVEAARAAAADMGGKVDRTQLGAEKPPEVLAIQLAALRELS